MEYIGKGKNLMYYVDAADFEYSFTLYLQKLFFFVICHAIWANKFVCNRTYGRTIGTQKN